MSYFSGRYHSVENNWTQGYMNYALRHNNILLEEIYLLNARMFHKVLVWSIEVGFRWGGDNFLKIFRFSVFLLVFLANIPQTVESNNIFSDLVLSKIVLGSCV